MASWATALCFTEAGRAPSDTDMTLAEVEDWYLGRGASVMRRMMVDAVKQRVSVSDLRTSTCLPTTDIRSMLNAFADMADDDGTLTLDAFHTAFKQCVMVATLLGSRAHGNVPFHASGP